MMEIKTYNSIYQKIYFNAVSGELEPVGEYRPLRPDFILGHDPLIAILIDDFKSSGFKIENQIKDKCFFTADHFAPPATAERANILKKFINFSTENEIKQTHIFEGICHQLMVESVKAKPFSFIAGSDSHTVTAGALSAFAVGYGSMDILSALASGVIYEKEEPVIAVKLTGTPKEYITGRDLGLEIISKIGEGRANHKVLEITDMTGNKISMDDRFAVSNMAVECGATSGIFVPDYILANYLAERESMSSGHFKNLFKEFESDIDYEYNEKYFISTGNLSSKIAVPHNFSKVINVRDLGRDIKLDQVFIGSCACGRLKDFADMCRCIDMISGKRAGKNIKKSPGVRLIITPSSQKIFLEAMERKYIQKLVEFGAVITNPSCGPCGGIDKGIIGDGEICLSTSTRNFQGRMGSMTSEIYIASAVTAISSAYIGKITAPEEFYEN